MKTYRQHEHAFAMDADDDLVVVDREGAKMLTLNAMGGMLWQGAESAITLEGLVALLAERWPDLDAAQLRADTQRFVDEALAAGILVSDS